jgi:hypothetical protein
MDNKFYEGNQELFARAFKKGFKTKEEQNYSGVNNFRKSAFGFLRNLASCAYSGVTIVKEESKLLKDLKSSGVVSSIDEAGELLLSLVNKSFQYSESCFDKITFEKVNKKENSAYKLTTYSYAD